MKLQDHIDQVSARLREEIGRVGVVAASKVLGVNKSYACRIKAGQDVSTGKLIELANKMGLDV